MLGKSLFFSTTPPPIPVEKVKNTVRPDSPTVTYERNKDAADTENKYVITCMNTDRLCLFTDTGKMHTIKVLDIPYGKFRDKGTPVDNMSNFTSEQERIIGLFAMNQLKTGTLIFGTSQSMIKKVSGSEFDVSKRTVAATKLAENDLLVFVGFIEEHTHLALRTKDGIFLRFPLEEVPEKKKGAVGVRGMKLSAKDSVEDMYLLKPDGETTITYQDKEVILEKLRSGKRDMKGSRPK